MVNTRANWFTVCCMRMQRRQRHVCAQQLDIYAPRPSRYNKECIFWLLQTARIKLLYCCASHKRTGKKCILQCLTIFIMRPRIKCRSATVSLIVQIECVIKICKLNNSRRSKTDLFYELYNRLYTEKKNYLPY